jgi:protein TonB
MENKIKDLDDLIFRERNKKYGAYANRKNYSRYMFLALVGGITVFLTAISAPLIASYVDGVITEGRHTVVIEDTLVTIDHKIVDVVIPPTTQPKPMYKPFVVPKVVDDPDDVVDISDMIDKIENRKVDDSSTVGPVDIPDDKQPVLDIPKQETFLIVEEMPEFPGGDEGRIKYLAANVKYPQSARELGIQGIVYVSFVVDETGKVVEVELLRGIGGGCDEEAMRVVKNMPNWKPGRQTGKEVRVKFSVSINFRLENG